MCVYGFLWDEMNAVLYIYVYTLMFIKDKKNILYTCLYKRFQRSQRLKEFDDSFQLGPKPKARVVDLGSRMYFYFKGNKFNQKYCSLVVGVLIKWIKLKSS